MKFDRYRGMRFDNAAASETPPCSPKGGIFSWSEAGGAEVG